DRNRSHWSTSKTPSYTKSVSWQHHRNNGLAYGDGHKLPFNKVRWVALVGGDKESFVQMGWEKNISDYLKNMCSYLGIEDVDVTFLCNTVVFDGEELHASYYQSLLSQVRDMVDAL
ncbi:NAD(P)H-dependent oxidoreductase, partial [Escherichia coli]|nr:NAD(P)H-dependent oxidoreductase [Escherichia coli]MDA6803852.1 NAD(P)H-dependent oxidoreductase [Escherichia coli]